MRAMKISSVALSTAIAYIAISIASVAKAEVIYAYEGNDFTSFNPTQPSSTSLSLTGWFSTADPLLDSFLAIFPGATSFPVAEISGAVQDYSFTDGRQTLDSSNSEISRFRVMIDGSGLPTEWSIIVRVLFPDSLLPGDPVDGVFQRRISTQNGAGLNIVQDLSQRIPCTSVNPDGTCAGGLNDFGVNENSPGSWRIVTAAVPEPGSLGLLLLGIAAFGVAKQRRPA